MSLARVSVKSLWVPFLLMGTSAFFCLARARDNGDIIETISIEAISLSVTTSVRTTTEELNRQGIKATRGGAWHPTAVARLLNRLSRAA